MKKILHNSFFVIGGSIILTFGVAVTAYYYASKKPTPGYIMVKRGDLVEAVTGSGTVKAAQDVELAFEKSGRIISVVPKVGDSVYAGEVLVTLDNSDLGAQLDQALANVKAQQARLDQLHQGVQPEALALKNTAVESATVALDQTMKLALDSLENAYTVSDTAVHATVDQFFINSRSASPQLAFSTSDSQLKVNLEAERSSLETELATFKMGIDAATATTDLSQPLAKAYSVLHDVSQFLDNAALALESANPNQSVPAASVTLYESQVAVAKGNVQTAS